MATRHRIRRIRVYRAVLPLDKEGAYRWSGGKSVEAFDSTFVAIETDSGLTGWGEVSPLGPFYLPAYAEGARTGIKELGPHLIGADATELEAINRLMDRALKGHPYVKCALDIACWDILGQVAGVPVATLLGGRYGETIALYRSLSQGTAEEMADLVTRFQGQGFRHFQAKVGGDPDLDIARIRAAASRLRPGDRLVADANTGWLVHEAARVVRGVRDIDVYIEQPCLAYEDCLSIRRRCDHPFVLDESIDSLEALLRAHRDRAMDAINLKISKFGGLTRSRQARDLCLALGIAMTIEDTSGSDITAAAVTHLAHSTPEEFRLSVTISNVKLSIRTAEGAPLSVDGRTAAPTAPGLGVKAKLDVLGDPIAVIG